MNENPLLQKHILKSRNPNIDFIRISGMFSIVIHHMIVHGKAIVKYKSYDELKLFDILCNWHVSSFAIISGIVGNKNHKFSNLLHLWFQTIFYSIIFYSYYNKSHNPPLKQDFIRQIFPVIYKQYWYFTSYFGIYPFLPFINTGISNLPKIVLQKTVYFMIGIFILWPSFHRDVFSQNLGCSPFSLLIFYIFGAYIGKYIFFKKIEIIKKIKIIDRFLIYGLCIIIFFTFSLLCYNIRNVFYNYYS